MLISLKYKFIFVANTKAASSAIEKQLRPYSEIALMRPPGLKHVNLHRIIKEFKFVAERGDYDFSKFEKFGVIRDPVAWLVSWFNYRSRDKARGRDNYTGDLSFDEFLDEFFEKDAKAYARLGTQYTSFVDEGGKILADTILLHDNLQSEFSNIIDKLDLPESTKQLTKRNDSDIKRIKPEEVSEEQLQKIKQILPTDFRLYEAVKSGDYHSFQV